MQRSQVILVFRILLATCGLVHSCSTDKTDREEENEHTNSHTLSQVHCGKRSRIEKKKKKKKKKAYSWLATTTNHTTSSSFLQHVVIGNHPLPGRWDGGSCSSTRPPASSVWSFCVRQQSSSCFLRVATQRSTYGKVIQLPINPSGPRVTG
jgi:hypothetical protein